MFCQNRGSDLSIRSYDVRNRANTKKSNRTMTDTNVLGVAILSPTVLVGILINNHRIGYVNKSIERSDVGMNRHIDDTKELLRADIKAFRV